MNDLPVISIQIVEKLCSLRVVKNRFTPRQRPQDLNDAPSLTMGSRILTYEEYSEIYKELKDKADFTGSVCIAGSSEGK